MKTNLILAFMQNQWVKDPDRVRAMLAANPGIRRRFIARTLFAGCRSGQVLNETLGVWTDRITWEEASPEIGGHASSVFPADLAHMRAAIEELKPQVVIGFGRVATDALEEMRTPHIHAPHPAARGIIALVLLDAIRQNLEALFNVTVSYGLLYRNGEVLPCPEADAVAQARGFLYAERLVRWLEANP